MPRKKGTTIARIPISKNELDDLLYYTKYSVVKFSTQEKLTKCFILLFHSGMRASELLLLTEKSIESILEKGFFSLPNATKTKKPRLVILSKQGVEDIRELFEMELVGNSNRKLFTGKKEGLVKLLNFHIHECLGELYSSHAFRSGYVRDMLKKAPASLVQSAVGHSSVSTTLRYDFSSEQDIKTTINLIR